MKIMVKIKDISNKIFKSRSFIYGGPSVAIIAIVLSIAVAVVLLSDSLLNIKIDLTKDKLYSISDITKDVLRDLDNDVTVYKLFDQATLDSYESTLNPINMAITMLDDFGRYSDKVKYITIDPDKNPEIINELDPNNSKRIVKNEVVFKSGKNVKNVRIDVNSNLDESQNYIIEQAFVGALRQVTKEVVPTVYVVSGHGEASLDENYTFVKLGFEQNGYEVKTLPNIISAGIPSDASLILFVSPKSDLNAEEVYIVKKYLEEGGKGTFLFDPVLPDVSFSGFNEVLRDYNIAVKNSVIYEKDPNNHPEDHQEKLILKLQGGPLFDAAQINNISLVFNKATEIEALRTGDVGATITKWIYTSDKAESRSIKSGEIPRTGSFPIIVTSEYTKYNNISRVFVSANSTFVSDETVNIDGTGAGIMLFGGIINWVQGETDEIIIEGKLGDIQEFNINEVAATVLKYLIQILLPLAIVLLGLFIWYRRRHL